MLAGCIPLHAEDPAAMMPSGLHNGRAPAIMFQLGTPVQYRSQPTERRVTLDDQIRFGEIRWQPTDKRNGPALFFDSRSHKLWPH